MAHAAPHAPPGLDSSSTPGRLDGWKEIAAYIGRGVRTAQRWEKELGLPVRRQVTGTSDTPYAVPAEIDEWRERMTRLSNTSRGRDTPDNGGRQGDGILDTGGVGPSGEVTAGQGPASDSRVDRSRWKRLAVLVAVAMVGILAISAWLAWTPAVNPHALRASGNTLYALGPDGKELWSEPFDTPLTEAFSAGALRQQTRLVDLDGDGLTEVAFARSDPADPGLFLFSARGARLFRHRVERSVQFGAQTFGSSWECSMLFVAPDSRSLLGAFHVPDEFGAVIRELDSRGRLLGEYWSNGYVTGFARFRAGDVSLTFVGAAFNETGGAALSVFTNGLRGSAPARTDKYRCRDCPDESPAVFLVFPRSRIGAKLELNASVTTISALGPDRYSIRVHPGTPVDSAAVYYQVDGRGRVLSADIGSTVRAEEDRLVREGIVIAGDVTRGQEDLFPVLRWNGTGFETITGPER